MKRFFILLVIGIAIIVFGLFLSRQLFFQTQYEELAAFLPEESLSFFLELPHFYDSMEELFTQNRFFENFNRENLQMILPEDTWHNLASILDDPYVADPSKSRRLFNEQIIAANYSSQPGDFQGIIGIRGKFHPEEYYTLITSMRFLQEEGFLIKEYNGQTYYEGKLSFDSPLYSLGDEEDNYYIFNLKNCFFVSNSENLVRTVLDFYDNPKGSVAQMDLFSRNKRHRSHDSTITWGFTKDVLENITEFYYSTHPNMIQGVSISETPVRPAINTFDTLAAYYKPGSLFSHIDSSSSYGLYEAYFEKYFPMIDAYLEAFEYQPLLDFIQNTWEGGYFFELDLDIYFTISPVFNLLFPLQAGVDAGVIDEIAAFLEPSELQWRRENNVIYLENDADRESTRIFYDSTRQLLGVSSADISLSTANTEPLLSQMLAQRTSHGFSGIPAGFSHLNGEKLDSLYENALGVLAFLPILNPDLAPYFQFTEKIIKSFDHLTGYSYFIDQDKPVIESVTYFQAR